MAVHERARIAFVLGPGVPVEGDDGPADAWARWSAQHVAPVVVGWLERYAGAHPDLPEDSDDDEDEDDAPVRPMDRYTLSTLRQYLPDDDAEIDRRLEALGWEE